MRYEGTKHKLDKSFQGENKNSQDAEVLQKLDLNAKPELVLKIANIVHLIQNYDSSNGIIHIDYPFNERVILVSGGPGQTVPFEKGEMLIFNVNIPNFPEWCIPFTKIIPKVHMEDGFNPEDYNGLQLVTNCRHMWKYIDGINWQIRVEITSFVRISYPYNYIPLFLDVDLVIINDRVWEEINSSKD